VAGASVKNQLAGSPAMPTTAEVQELLSDVEVADEAR